MCPLRWLRVRILRVGDTINVYIGGSGPADPRVDTILTKLGDMMSANADAVKQLEARIDAATTAISDRIDTLISQIGTGMTQAEVDDLKAAMSAEADKLDALGKPVTPLP
jgi:hypothetical protein